MNEALTIIVGGVGLLAGLVVLVRSRPRPALSHHWSDDDVATLRDEYVRGELTIEQFEDGLDDVFGVDGGIGHAKACMIDLPSGACTCGGWRGTTSIVAYEPLETTAASE
jgi:hypothetical protein